MKKFFKDFFSTSNEINEDTVVGMIFVIATLIAAFLPVVGVDKFYVLSGLVAASFGIGALKK